MKLEFRPFSSFRTAVLVFILVLSGCATTGRERATETTTSMWAVEKDYQQALLQIDETNASLEDLVRPQQDMKGKLKETAGKLSREVVCAVAIAAPRAGFSEHGGPDGGRNNQKGEFSCCGPLR